MNLENVIFTDNLPQIDLHGLDRLSARIKINEFINDNKKMKESIIVIVHGVGSGILRLETINTLKNNKVFYNNNGMTIVKIKIDK